MAARSSMVDYYTELGVNHGATSNDIRAAYKRLALLWHPDRNKSKDAEERFKKIKQAYDVLTDDSRRREYDQEQNTRSEKTARTNGKYTPAHEDLFNLHAFDNLISTPIDPFDILNDIQFFQDSDFTSKMLSSPIYRDFYTQIFHSMNNDPKSHRHKRSSSPIYLNNDRLFRPKPRSKHHSSARYSTIDPIPVIHSTMANDLFLNELIDLHEQQKPMSFLPSKSDPFFNELNHCRNCHRRISANRTSLIEHEEQCRKTSVNQHRAMPAKSARV